MALIDNALVLANGVALTASGIVGAEVNFRFSDIGAGKELELVLISNTAGTGSGSGNSFYYELRTAASTAGLAAGAIIARSDVIPGASHTAGGVVWRVKIPAGLALARIALYAVEAGTATANVSAFIVGNEWQHPMGMRTPIAAAS